jgi:hypothetical protein
MSALSEYQLCNAQPRPSEVLAAVELELTTSPFRLLMLVRRLYQHSSTITWAMVSCLYPALNRVAMNPISQSVGLKGLDQSIVLFVCRQVSFSTYML